MHAQFTAAQKSVQVKKAMRTGATDTMDLSNAGRIKYFLRSIGHEAEIVDVGKFRNRQPKVQVVIPS